MVKSAYVKLAGVLSLGVLLIFLSVPSAQSGFWERFKSTVGPVKGDTSHNNSSLSQQEIIEGLRDALQVAAKRAVQVASSEGGFLNNPNIHIPLPPKLQKAASILRHIGYKDDVDTFEATLNHAAEKASVKALPIFIQAIKDLTFQDAKTIWKGGDTAATDYFKGKTWEPLSKAFEPVVHEAVQQVGVTKAYQDLTEKPLVHNITQGTSMDLDSYVTDKTLEGLFFLLGQEEKKIRKDPMARTTDILRKVFGQR